jgi:uncharacterized membrane protein YccC
VISSLRRVVVQAWTAPRDRYTTLRVAAFVLMVASAVLGSLLGTLSSRRDWLAGAAIGALIGLGVAVLLTPIWYLDSKRHHRRRVRERERP